jgi:hypothetical protein
VSDAGRPGEFVLALPVAGRQRHDRHPVMTARTWRSAAAALAVGMLATATAASAGHRHETWRYVPQSWQASGATSFAERVAESLVGPVDGVDGVPRSVTLAGRRVVVTIDDVAALDGQTVPTELVAVRAGRRLWRQVGCLPVREPVRVPGLRRGDRLVVGVYSNAELWEAPLDRCTGHAVGGTIDVRS